jgi:hypothetical protein
LDKTKWLPGSIRVIFTYDEESTFVIPRKYALNFLAVDRDRRFAKAKNFVLKRVMTIAEMLAN